MPMIDVGAHKVYNPLYYIYIRPFAFDYDNLWL